MSNDKGGVDKEGKGKSRGMREIPMNNLDAEMILTNPVWGREIPEELYNKLQEKWGELGFYTRDLRLGNLKDEQELEVNYYLNLAGECLQRGCVESFMFCLRKAITMTEVSQSRNMSLRKIMNTLTYENVNKKDEGKEEKKGLIGDRRK